MIKNQIDLYLKNVTYRKIMWLKHIKRYDPYAIVLGDDIALYVCGVVAQSVEH